MTNKLNNEQEVKLILSVIVDNYCNEFNDDYGECWEAVELQFINELYKIIAAEVDKAREEGVHLGVNNFETWMKQYHEDKDFVGSFGDWINKLLTSTQEKD